MNKLILIKGRRKIITNACDILYCEADGKYTKIVLLNEEFFISGKCLKDIESAFQEDGVCRVHRKYAINLNYLKEYRLNGENCLILNNGTEIPISIRRITSIINSIRNFINGDLK